MAATSTRLKSRRNLANLYRSKRSRRQVVNAPRRDGREINPNRLDPTRTITMRKKMAAHVKRQFAILRGRILKLVVDEDAFGLVERKPLAFNRDLRSVIEAAASEADPNPTEAQTESGNYRKGHVSIQGLQIAIETAAGGLRKGKYKIAHHYGYIERTESEADGDHVDVFIGDHPESEIVFVVDQYKLDGSFDEHKCMLGFLSTQEAKQGYLANYSKDWKGFGGIRALTMPKFKEWLESGDTSSPIFDQSITFNVFCPTGEGGGVDPSRGHEGLGAEGWVQSQDSWKGKVETERASISGRDIRPAPGVPLTASTVKKYEKQILKDVEVGKPLRPLVVAKDEDGKYFLHDGNHYFKALSNLKKQGHLADVKEVPVVVVKPKEGYRFETQALAGGSIYAHTLVENVFCPTGVGGGIDPSCSGGVSKAEAVAALDKQPDANGVSTDKTAKDPFYAQVPFKVADDLELYKELREVIRTGKHKRQEVALEELTATQTSISRKRVKDMIEMRDAKGHEYLKESVVVVELRGAKYLFDGTHRSSAALFLGDKTIKASVYRPKKVTKNVFCATGEGGGIDPTCGSGEGSPEDAKAVETLSKGMLAKAKATLDKVPGAKWLREKSAAMYDGLVKRYGKKVAIAVVASGQAISWGAFAVGVATGVPIWVPSAAATAPGAAVAELHYRIKGKGKASKTENEEGEDEPDPVLVARLAREFIDELENGWSRLSPTVNAPAPQRRWQFNTTAEQVKLFQAWLKAQFKAVLTSKREEELWNQYIQDGLRKGAGRAFDDMSKPYAKEYAKDESTRDFYTGSKEQFLRDSFRQPVAKDTVKLLAGRTFDDLNGVTEAMSVAMSRTLTDGLVQGKNPREVARDLNKNVDGIGQNRALTIARTELIRAHAEGQLTAMEQMGVEDVGVAVEWHTSHLYTVDKKGNPISPCELCIPMEGVILTIAEAHGMIPRHPNCKCSWVPANVGEDPTDQKRSFEAVQAAFEESGIEPFVELDESRPESIFNALVEWEQLGINVFCPTGEGGGIDPSCRGGDFPDKVVHGGKTYSPTGKMGTSFKTGNPSQEYESDDGDTHWVEKGAPPTKEPIEVDPVEESYQPVGKGKIQFNGPDKSVEIFDKLPARQRDRLIAGRLAVRKKQHGESAKDYELRKVNLKAIKPSQQGEDRLNESSKGSAADIATGDLSRIAEADITPILLDEALNIIDGNHRYTAAELNGQEAIYALVRKTTRNVFCPTGLGGGVDPGCPAGEGGVGTAPISTEVYRKMTAEERTTAGRWEREGIKLGKKIKDGTATPEDITRREEVLRLGRQMAQTARERPDSPETKVETKKEEKVEVETSQRAGMSLSKQAFAEQFKDFAHTERLGHVVRLLRAHAVPVKGVKVHGMTNPEDMQEVTLDGVKIRFTRDSEIQAAQDVKMLVEKQDIIPTVVWQSTGEITYTDQRNSRDGYWEKTYGIPGFVSAATGGDGGVVVYNGGSMGLEVYAHEAGHNLASALYGSTSPRGEYAAAQQVESPVSSYGAKSSSEDFAEAVALYVSRPHDLKNFYPKKYAALDKLIKENA